MTGSVHTFQVRNSHVRLVVEEERPGGNWRIVRHGIKRKVLCAFTNEESALSWARSYLGNRAYDASVRVGA
jgi:hypothetical protein